MWRVDDNEIFSRNISVGIWSTWFDLYDIKSSSLSNKFQAPQVL